MHPRQSLVVAIAVACCVFFGDIVQAQEANQKAEKPFSLLLSPVCTPPRKIAGERTVFEVPEFRLAASQQELSPSSTETEMRTHSDQGANWDIWGPVRMRSADPEEPGELEIKNIFDYGTSSDGTDDDFEYELEIEWGIAPNHELIFELPVEMGDGEVRGNADITLGWHCRLWEEQEILPAFAMRNYIRIPSGYHSSGVDYELRGLITKSIVPDKWRLHLNPFLKSVNGHNKEDHRYFQWGFIAGTDYRLAENLVLNLDYVHETGECEGQRNQHTMEVGLDWKFAHNQGLGFVARTGLDGDGIGENFGVAISYVYCFDGFPAVGR